MRGTAPDSSGDTQGEPSSGDAFESAYRNLREDSSIQFELPRANPPEPQAAPLDLGSVGDMGALPQILFWFAIALAAAGLLYLIVGRLSGWQRRAPGAAEAEPEWQMAPEPARQLLGEADALAAQGLYSQAAHLLLHRSIEEIDLRRPAAVRKALTSRDIARLPAIPPSPAQAFGSIVQAVERSLFGGRALDAGDWGQCRAAYERFAFAREWQA